MNEILKEELIDRACRFYPVGVSAYDERYDMHETTLNRKEVTRKNRIERDSEWTAFLELLSAEVAIEFTDNTPILNNEFCFYATAYITSKKHLKLHIIISSFHPLHSIVISEVTENANTIMDAFDFLGNNAEKCDLSIATIQKINSNISNAFSSNYIHENKLLTVRLPAIDMQHKRLSEATTLFDIVFTGSILIY